MSSLWCQDFHSPSEGHLETFLFGLAGTAPLAKQRVIHVHGFQHKPFANLALFYDFFLDKPTQRISYRPGRATKAYRL